MQSFIDKFNARIPSKEKLSENRSLKWLFPLLKKRQLWIIKRRTVANALFVGMISAFTPWPLQMIQAAIMSIFFNANVPIAVTLVWITNPITMGPIFYATYKIGAFILDFEGTFPDFELSFEWLGGTFMTIWQPLLLGSFLVGIISGVSLWFLCHVLWHKKNDTKTQF